MTQDEWALRISFTADRLQSYQRMAAAMMIDKKPTVAAGA
jgi:hypothetical protein